MKFGKEFRIHLEETLPEWRDKFLCYKPLKKLLKNISPPAADAPSLASLPNIAAAAQPWIGLEEWFVRILDEELDKFNDFYIDKEEDFVIRLQTANLFVISILVVERDDYGKRLSTDVYDERWINHYVGKKGYGTSWDLGVF
ncbi:SPX domain-containing protein 4 [Asimina triloba]